MELPCRLSHAERTYRAVFESDWVNWDLGIYWHLRGIVQEHDNPKEIIDALVHVPDYVWRKEMLGLTTAGALLIGNFLPGGGEIQDAFILADPHAGVGEKILAGGSLAVNAVTLGFAPNFGMFGRAGRAGADAAQTASRLRRHTDAVLDSLKVLEQLDDVKLAKYFDDLDDLRSMPGIHSKKLHSSLTKSEHAAGRLSRELAQAADITDELTKSVGISIDALPRQIAVGSPEWQRFHKLITSDDSLKATIGGRQQSPKLTVGPEVKSQMLFDADAGVYDIRVQSTLENGVERVNLGVLAEETQHALERVRGIHPGRAEIRGMMEQVQRRLPVKAPLNQGRDIVNNMWHVGVFSRLGDELSDSGSIFRRSGIWTADDADVFHRLAQSMRSDTERIPEKFRLFLDLYLQSFK